MEPLKIDSVESLCAYILNEQNPISSFPKVIWHTLSVCIGPEESSRIQLVEKIKIYYAKWGNTDHEKPIFLDELDLNVK